jgi:hypothetical protein
VRRAVREDAPVMAHHVSMFRDMGDTREVRVGQLSDASAALFRGVRESGEYVDLLIVTARDMEEVVGLERATSL